MPEVVNGRNGLGLENGDKPHNETAAGVTPAKRPHPEGGAEDAVSVKRAKSTAAPSVGGDDDVVFIDDSAGGAIVIDD